MSQTIKYKLHRPAKKGDVDEVAEFQKFCDALRGTGTEDFLSMSRDQIAKQALFYAISDANARAAKMQQEQQKKQDELLAANHAAAMSKDEFEVQPAGVSNETTARDTPSNSSAGSNVQGAGSALHAQPQNDATNSGTVS